MELFFEDFDDNERSSVKVLRKLIRLNKLYNVIIAYMNNLPIKEHTDQLDDPLEF